MSGLNDLTRTMRDINQITSQARNTMRNVGQTVHETAKTKGEIQGFDGNSDQVHYQANSRGDDAHLRAFSSRERLLAAENGQAGGYDQYYDPRGSRNSYGYGASPYASREAYAGSLGFSRQGGNQRQTPEDALVTSVMLANMYPENGQYHSNALNIANGMRGQDGLIHLSGSVNKNINGHVAKINFGGRSNDMSFTSTEEAYDYISSKTGFAPGQQAAYFQRESYTPGRDGSAAGMRVVPDVERHPPESTLRSPGAPADLLPPGFSDKPSPLAAAAPPLAQPAAGATAALSSAATKVSAVTAESAKSETATPESAAEPSVAKPAAPETKALSEKEQKELNQKAQMYLEQLGHNTGDAWGHTKSNHITFINASADKDVTPELDGVVGRRTRPALEAEGFNAAKPITLEIVAALKTKAEVHMAALKQHAIVQAGADKPVPSAGTAGESVSTATGVQPPSVAADSATKPEADTKLAGDTKPAADMKPVVDTKPAADAKPVIAEDSAKKPGMAGVTADQQAKVDAALQAKPQAPAPANELFATPSFGFSAVETIASPAISPAAQAPLRSAIYNPESSPRHEFGAAPATPLVKIPVTQPVRTT